jgi:hypothetical protein
MTAFAISRRHLFAELREGTVKALRAKATDVDVSIKPRKEWARLHEERQLAKA